MAQIKEYNSSLADSGLSPSQLGISATEAAASSEKATAYVATSTGARIKESYNEMGRAIGGGISAAGDAAGKIYQQYVEQPDINQAALNITKTSAEISNAWDDALKNAPQGGGPAVQKKFLDETLEDRLDALTDSAQTKAGKQYIFDEAVKLRDHMFKTTTAEVATRAGQEVMTALDEQKNILSNDVRLHPEKFDLNAALFDSAVQARINSAPGISADVAGKVRTTMAEHAKTEFAHAAILGTAVQNPEAAAALLNSGKFDKYIDGTQVSSMIKNIDYANRATQNFQRAEQDRQAQAVSDKAAVEYETRMKTDPKSVSAIDALNDPRLTDKHKLIVAKTIDRESKPEADAKISRETSVGLYKRIYAGADDPSRLIDADPIREAFYKGQLTRQDRDDLLKNLDQIKTPEGQKLGADRAEFFKRYARTIDPDMDRLGNVTAKGDQAMYMAQLDATRREAILRQKGDDPHSLYDPSSPNFFGNPTNLKKYQVPMDQYMRQEAQERAALARKPDDNSQVPGVDTVDIPPGMSPADAMKWAKEQGAKRVKLPDGRMGTVQ
jgi:hypothetical protein